MARKENEAFDWLDDPFDEKKAAQEQARAATSGGTKLALGCGCLFAVAGIVALFVVLGIGMVDALVV